MTETNLDLGKELKNRMKIVVNVKMPKFFDLRMWIGTKVIYLGSLIAGLGWGGIKEITDG